MAKLFSNPFFKFIIIIYFSSAIESRSGNVPRAYNLDDFGRTIRPLPEYTERKFKEDDLTEGVIDFVEKRKNALQTATTRALIWTRR